MKLIFIFVKLVTAVCYFSMINIVLRCRVSQKTPKYRRKNIKVRCNITTYCRASPNCIACHVNDIKVSTIVVLNSYIATSIKIIFLLFLYLIIFLFLFFLPFITQRQRHNSFSSSQLSQHLNSHPPQRL